MTEPLPNLRPAALAVIRQALAALPTGDSVTVGRSLRMMFDGQRRMERVRFATTLAWMAAIFAAELDSEARERIFARYESSDQVLALEALGLLLAAAANRQVPRE